MPSLSQPWQRHVHTLSRHVVVHERRHLSTARCNPMRIRHGTSGFVAITKPSPNIRIHRHPAFFQKCTHSTKNESATATTAATVTADNTSPKTTTTPSKKRGVFSTLRHFLRTIFGANESSPRGIQERKDIYFVLLALEHYKLRLNWQSDQKQLRVSDADGDASMHDAPKRVVDDDNEIAESKEHVAALLDRAACNLDQDSSGIHDLSLGKLRRELQSRIGHQVVHLLNVARLAEEEFRRTTDDAEVMRTEEEYVFHSDREKDYNTILWKEYEDVERKMHEWVVANGQRESSFSILSSQHQFYRIKTGAIQRLLHYYDGWPQHVARKESTELDDGEQDEFGFCPSQFRSDVIPAMRYHHAKNLIRSYYARNYGVLQNQSPQQQQHHQQQQKFSIIALKSTIPNAGRGVYIDGKAIAGTLLAFFPGKIWPKEHLMAASLQTQRNLSENDPRHQLSMRYDDILIDSRRSPYTVIDNMWALGHVVNHPPAPTMAESRSPGHDQDSSASTQCHYHCGPNCVTVPIDFTESMLEQHPELRRYIPNEYELPPQSWAKNAFDTENVIMNGMGIISSRDVEDEELFYDYRLSPDKSTEGNGSGQYPKWYHVWDDNAMKNRWSTDDE